MQQGLTAVPAELEQEVQHSQAQCQRDEPAELHTQRVEGLLHQQDVIQATMDRTAEDIR